MSEISEHIIKGKQYLFDLEKLTANVSQADKTVLWKTGEALLNEVQQVMICVDRICNER